MSQVQLIIGVFLKLFHIKTWAKISIKQPGKLKRITTTPPCIMLLDEELLEGLSRLVELVLLDVSPDAVAHLRRYVLGDDGEEQILLKNTKSLRVYGRVKSSSVLFLFSCSPISGSQNRKWHK